MIRQSQWSRGRYRPPRRLSTPPADAETTSPVPRVVSSGPSSPPGDHPRDTTDLFAPLFSAREEQAVATAASDGSARRVPAQVAVGPLHRRAEIRKPLHIGLELIRQGVPDPQFAIGADLSPSGALVLADAGLDPKDYVVIRFRLPWSDERFAFLSQVVRVQPAPDQESGALHGFGIRFLDVTPAERTHLRQRQDFRRCEWVPQAIDRVTVLLYRASGERLAAEGSPEAVSGDSGGRRAAPVVAADSGRLAAGRSP